MGTVGTVRGRNSRRCENMRNGNNGNSRDSRKGSNWENSGQVTSARVLTLVTSQWLLLTGDDSIFNSNGRK